MLKNDRESQLPSKMKPTFSLLLLSLLLPACSDPEVAAVPPRASGKPLVYTVNYPLAWFAERLGDRAYEIVFPEIAGDPAFWEPADADIAGFQQADLILDNGATYAKWRDHVSLPESRIVDTSKSFAGRYVHISGVGTHSHGKDGDHSHDGIAFTTWIDFGQALAQAAAVRDALGKLQPPAATRVNNAWKELEAELKQLDTDMAELAFAIGDQPLIASHPVYQYFARAYNLSIKNILWEPETVPDEAAMAEFKKLHASHPAKWMIWEGEPAPESVAKLNALGVDSVVFDPCGNRPGGDAYADWLTVMRANIENLKELLPQQSN